MSKVFTTEELPNVTHEKYLEMYKAGELQLGIDNHVAMKLVTAGVKPTKDTTRAAALFFSWLAVGVFATSIYFSFTHHWAWFIAGFFGMRVIWKANKSGTAKNFVEAAVYDKDFYETVRGTGAWIYQMK